MKNFNIEISYSIISTIRAGISESVSEEDKITYNINVAEFVFQGTKGYDTQETIKFIKDRIEYYNAGLKLKPYRKVT